MMTEFGIDAGLPQTILHILTTNQEKGGLTVAEIRRALGIVPTHDKRMIKRIDMKIYKAISVLMTRGDIQRWTSPIDRRFGVYALTGQKEMPIEFELEELTSSDQLGVIKDARKGNKEDGSVTTDSQQSKLPAITAELFKGWNIALSPQSFPYQSGLYAFFSGITGDCLYVGRATNLRQRGCRQQYKKWKEIADNQECPYAAYKVIKQGEFDKTKQELVFLESLLIELLQPKLNVIAPLPKRNTSLGNHGFEQIELVHCQQFISKPHQSFHPLMLSDRGYVMLKNIESEGRWLRVLYDKDYANKWVEDLGNQIDMFFSHRESPQANYQLIKNNSAAPHVEVTIVSNVDVNLSVNLSVINSQ